MDFEEIKKTYPVQKDILEALRLTEEVKDYVSRMLTMEERRLKECDLWQLKDSQPYKHLEEAYWSLIDAINSEINFAAETLKNDVLDEMVNKLT